MAPLAALSSLPPIATVPDQQKNGQAFYAYFFTNHPDLRKYFKGAENFTAGDVHKSERFSKLGAGLLLEVQKIATNFPNDAAFKADVESLIERHIARNIDPALWKIFFDVFVGFLESVGSLNAAQKGEWKQIGEQFNAIAQAFLKGKGLPSA